MVCILYVPNLFMIGFWKDWEVKENFRNSRLSLPQYILLRMIISQKKQKKEKSNRLELLRNIAPLFTKCRKLFLLSTCQTKMYIVMQSENLCLDEVTNI